MNQHSHSTTGQGDEAVMLKYTLLGIFKAVILSEPLGIRDVHVILELWVFINQQESLAWRNNIMLYFIYK